MKLFIAIDLEGISGVVVRGGHGAGGRGGASAPAPTCAPTSTPCSRAAPRPASARSWSATRTTTAATSTRRACPASSTLVSGSPAPLQHARRGSARTATARCSSATTPWPGRQGAVLEHTWNYKVYVGPGGRARGRRVRHRRPARRRVRRAGALPLRRRQGRRGGAGARARHRHHGGQDRRAPRGGRAAASPDEARAPHAGGRGGGAAGRRPSRRRSPGTASRSGSRSPASSSATSPRRAPGRRGWTGARWRSPARRFAEVYTGFLACLRLSEATG